MSFPVGKYRFARQRKGGDASSCVQALTFELGEEMLKVVFTDGSVYEYNSLSEDVYKEFKASSSRGGYFNENIRPYYGYTRIG